MNAKMSMVVREAVPEQLIRKGKNIASFNPQEQHEWLLEVGQTLRSWDDAIDLVALAEAQILYTVHEAWVNGELTLQATEPWGHDFTKWAKSYTKKRVKETSASIIEQKIGAYRDWVVDKEQMHAPETVFLPKRDESGRLLKAGAPYREQDCWEEIKFDPKTIDMSKLLLTRGAAREGRMTEYAWSVLADPGSTVMELKDALSPDGKWESQKSPAKGLKIWADSTGFLYASRDDVTVAFMAIVPETDGNPVAQQAQEYLFKLLNLNSPTCVQDCPRELPIAQKDGNTLVLNKGGYRFAEFVGGEIHQIVRVANSILRNIDEDF
jgi:hypothetical protein